MWRKIRGMKKGRMERMDVALTEELRKGGVKTGMNEEEGETD